MNIGFTTTFKIYGIGLDKLDHRNIALERRGRKSPGHRACRGAINTNLAINKIVDIHNQ